MARSTLRTGTGGPLSRDSFRFIVEVLGARHFTNVYGMSETSNSISRSFWHEPLEQKLRTNGKPVPGVGVHIVDVDSGEELPAGRTGEIGVLAQGEPAAGWAPTEPEAAERAW